jgi:hypothetical protein
MSSKNSQATLRQGLLPVFVLSVIAFYLIVDPASSPFGFPCLVKHMTGWSCWGCGGQRAFHQLLHGHFEKAFRLNALVFPFCLLSLYCLQAELRYTRHTYPFLRKKYVQIITLLVIAGFTVWRNV